MDIRNYEYIVAIAEHGSISRAAEQLFISQSALSKSLQRTEQLLGLKLFQRQGNRLTLTEIGHRYVDTGKKIILLDQELEDELSMERARQKGEIRLGCGMGWMEFILEQILPVFYEKYPGVQVYTRSETGQDQMEDLRHNRLDLGLFSDPDRYPGLNYHRVEATRLVLAVPWDSPLTAKAVQTEGAAYPVIPMEELNGLPMISMRNATRSGNLAKRIIAQYHLNPRVLLEVSDVRSLMDAVENGLGSAMLLSAPRGSRRLRYLCLAGIELPELSICLVYHAERKLSPAMQYLVKLFTEEFVVGTE